MAGSLAQNFLYGGIFFFLAVTIFLISAAAVPRFGVYTVTSSSQGSGSALMGAFQICAEVAGATFCAPISASCEVTLGEAKIPVPYCGTFNSFRGFLITSLLLAAFALIAALAHTCQASPNHNIAHFTFVSALLSIVASAISLVCWVSWGSASGSYAGLDGGSSGGSNTDTKGSFDNGPSFYLLIAALVGCIVGLSIWLYGRMQQRAESGQGGGMPHYHAAPAHFASDVQLHQPLTQQ